MNYNIYPIPMIISGGQSGVDRAALDFALASGIKCGGWCPAERIAEDCKIPLIYPLKETSSKSYSQRTRKNIKDSDATIVITDQNHSAGTVLTIRLAKRYKKPFIIIRKIAPKPQEALNWLWAIKPQIVNIAGPRESESPGLKNMVTSTLAKLFCHSDKIVLWPPSKPATPNLPTITT